MKRLDHQLEKISLVVINALRKSDAAHLVGKETLLREKIKEVILSNIREEESIDKEVKKIMEAYAGQIDRGEVDSRKVFGMIKAKLAKEKGFVL